MKQAVEDFRTLYGDEVNDSGDERGGQPASDNDDDSDDGLEELEKESRTFKGSSDSKYAMRAIPIYQPAKENKEPNTAESEPVNKNQTATKPLF